MSTRETWIHRLKVTFGILTVLAVLIVVSTVLFIACSYRAATTTVPVEVLGTEVVRSTTTTTVPTTTTTTTTTTTVPTTTTTTLPEVVTNPPWRWAGNPDKVWGYLGEASYTRADGVSVDQTQSYWGGIFLGIEQSSFVSSTTGKEVEVWLASFAFPNPDGSENIVGRFAVGFAYDIQSGRLMANKTFGVDLSSRIGALGAAEIANSELDQYMREGDLYFFSVAQKFNMDQLLSGDRCSNSPICATEMQMPDPFGLKYADALKRKLQGEDVELPADGFAFIGEFFLPPSQHWPTDSG